MSTPGGQDPYQPYDPASAQYGAQYGGYDPRFGQYQYPAPGQPYAGPMPGPNGEPPQDPDSALGIVGLVLSVAACSPVGLIVSWIALKKSKERGYRNTMALVGTIIGAVFTGMALLAVLAYVLIIALFVGVASTAPSLLL
ncbi:DUF4190 domain-containing protein [Tsukamurella sp. 1534]|uniref:DUF4190 domain-containing protein n=1 Tax=Tsukamurella sp. 1534 TaxID=1151061 RepID=UPI0002D64B98|nr:DUF4190 domain-containing protein [Tsukamurella sp. 1534]